MELDNLIVRCSELSQLMTKSRTKSNPMSETCKSYVMQKAKEVYYGIKPQMTNKYVEKGLRNEQIGIDLINQVRFMAYAKNEKRLTNGIITGECDINAKDRIIDVKCSWSWDTFPCYHEEAKKNMKKSGYDWQLRGYMWLYDKPKAEVIYCLTTTPDDLLGYSDTEEYHNVDHVAPECRMTSIVIERDASFEQEIKEHYEMANSFYKECLAELYNKQIKTEQWK